jgi:hypothetical protein
VQQRIKVGSTFKKTELTLSEVELNRLLEIAGQTIVQYLSMGSFRRRPRRPLQFEDEEEHSAFLTVSLPQRQIERKEILACFGYIFSKTPLDELIYDISIACVIRIASLRKKDLISRHGLLLELDVLESMEIVEGKPLERSKKIRIGQQGVLVQLGPIRALMLPQKAFEEGWSPMDFLSECCLKAGLSPDAWLEDRTRVYSFYCNHKSLLLSPSSFMRKDYEPK